MSYTLPPLPYAYDALEPHIDARTMEIHHQKHHQAYITNALNALAGHDELLALPVENLLKDISQVPEGVRPAVINNAGGHHNHSLFWTMLAPKAGGAPGGALAAAIEAAFGGFDGFKEQFAKAALTRFGSGWAWLGFDAAGKLHVGSTANQDSPLLIGHFPILGLDVWEHAYYLNYQNRRADYISAFWNVVNWERVAELFAQAK
jgi:superoxide dismutase, Fe-Mn family